MVLWDSDLTEFDITNLYHKGRTPTGTRLNKHGDDALDAAVDVLLQANSSLLPIHLPSARSSGSSGNEAVEDDELAQLFDSFTADDFAASTTAAKQSDPITAALLEHAHRSADACEYLERRLDLYAEAAMRGSADALFYWGMLVKYGTEASNSACGVTAAADGRYEEDRTDDDRDSGSSTFGGGVGALYDWMRYLASFVTTQSAAVLPPNPASALSARRGRGSFQRDYNDQQRATYAFIVAADMGLNSPLLPLSIIMLTGLGAEPLLHGHVKISVDWDVPVPDAYRNSAADAANGANTAHYKPSRLHVAITRFLLRGSTSNGRCSGCDSVGNSTAGSVSKEHGLSGMQLSAWSDERALLAGSVMDFGAGVGGASAATSLAVGLLHVAALHRITEAHQSLAYRYRFGLSGLVQDIEAAAHYSLLPVALANQEYHRIGAQPIVQADRINDITAPQVFIMSKYCILLRAAVISFAIL